MINKMMSVKNWIKLIVLLRFLIFNDININDKIALRKFQVEWNYIIN